MYFSSNGPGFKMWVKSFCCNLQKNCTKKIFTAKVIMMVITHLEPDMLECEVKLALGSIIMNKASVRFGIPIEIFQTLEDDAVILLY